ncbi:DUF2169 family type VI secretion system accessory protein [Taylorella asinigenitalis]|uniref:DUF2169 family type VI secretion system accessory protein n=1 Tax=Taylorella asinigenitalis TaxID=84590 RepID=UPI00048D9DB0|nr:DUF2169 domain-containing protein [Taylorella asinigenitalis]
MRIIKPLSTSLFYRVYEFNRQTYLSLSVNLYIDKNVDEVEFRLLSEQQMWQDFTSISVKDFNSELIDFGMPKDKPEIIVNGYAYGKYSENNRSAVNIEAGNINKTLTVYGDRFWINGQPSSPEGFDKLPISLSKAFGGKNVPSNTLGKGSEKITKPDGTVVTPLPNVEDPNQPVIYPDKVYPVATFSALPIESPNRNKLLGTYDRNWLEKFFPGFASDIDWSYFNLSPVDQRLATINGLEMKFTNMNPYKKIVYFKIPDLKPLIFLLPRGDKSLKTPLELKLQSCLAYPHKETYILSYHVSTPVESSEVADIFDFLMLAIEKTHSKRSLEHYQNVLNIRSNLRKANLYATFDEMLIDQGIDFKGLPSVPLNKLLKRKLFELKRKLSNIKDINKKAENLDLELVEDAKLNFRNYSYKPDFEKDLKDTLAQLTSDSSPASQEFKKILSSIDSNNLYKLFELVELDYIEMDFLLKLLVELDESKDESVLETARKIHTKRKELNKKIESIENFEVDPDEKLKYLNEKFSLTRNKLIETVENRKFIDTSNRNKTDSDLDSFFKDHDDKSLMFFESNAPTIVYNSNSVNNAVDSVVELTHINQLFKYSVSGIKTEIIDKDFKDLDLTGKPMQHCSFRNVSFLDVDFSDSLLGESAFENCEFINCKFLNCNLNEAELKSCKLISCDLNGINNDNSKFHNVIFLKCNITLWNHTRFVSSNILFNDCNIYFVTFNRAIIKDIEFYNCKINKLTIISGKYNSIKLINSEALSLNFSTDKRFVIESFTIENSKLDSFFIKDLSKVNHFVIKDSKLVLSTIRQCEFDSFEISNCDLKNINLSKSIIRNSKFSKVDLSNSIFTGSKIEDSLWYGIDLSFSLFNKLTILKSTLKKISFFSSDVSELSVDSNTVFDENYLNRMNIFPKLRN